MKAMKFTATTAIATLALSVLISGCGSGSNSSNSFTDQNGRLIGNWGSKSTSDELILTSEGGVFHSLGGCFGGALSGPILPDSNGRFNVAGVYRSNIIGTAVHYEGIVTGNTITMHLIRDSNGVQDGDIVLIYGQAPVPFTSGCPG